MARGRRIEIKGIVQGVGFRPWVYRLAHEEGLGGRVWNHSRGVTIEAFGTDGAIERFIDRLVAAPPPAARIQELKIDLLGEASPDQFTIVESEPAGGRDVSIPPDLATCPECVAEIFDPSNRRFRYPFTNCTSCGPRFTIAQDVPYDRPATTMVWFEMCPACQREYDSPEDRRFHAQPNACPVCGPRLVATTPTGDPLCAEDPIRLAAAALHDGLIVALKGIGGFHLACDATSADAVRLLRRRKRRDEKPFAVMVRDLDLAGRLAWLSPEECRLLSGPERPIVLVERRMPSTLADEVAPGNPLTGLMLPYSPLHHLLLADVARPLVMTSGNLSDEPLAYCNDEALASLGDIADLFLLHDRDIVTRCDDSVARVIAGRPVILRRSRGYVPRPLELPRRIARPVLACGALLKNTFCLAAGNRAYFGPHIGDLENVETFGSYRESIDRMERFLAIRPEIVAHDLHPDYLSTIYALARTDAIRIAVQHHHAHVASVMVEHQLNGPVFGVAYDGTGLGTDGTSWGGELLVATFESFERLATFRPLRLPGGDAAVREPWRTAVALLDDAFDGMPPTAVLDLLRQARAGDIAVIRMMIARGLNSPLAHGVGRYFDAVGALALGRRTASYEGQVALELNLVADSRENGSYGFDLDQQQTPWLIDLRPAVRTLAIELLSGVSAGLVSARFHNTLARATVAAVQAAAAHLSARLPVVLTGGCFQNARLAEAVASSLSPDFDVFLHGQVPTGDGGLALGQAAIAATVAQGGAP